ncbi:MAG: hypothetical protein ACRDJM_07965 [Actinomycetota bacterium]
MKTTIELPDELFREVKATAARRGIALREYVRQALVEKLSQGRLYRVRDAPREWPVPPLDPPLSREEAELIDKAIEDAFEQIEPEDHM